MKLKKGSYGYIDRNKRISFMKSMSGLAVILVVFVLGLILTKTRLNWFTFASVLCALPVGKMMVASIMAFPHKSIPQMEYDKIKEKEEGITIIYDLVITSYESIMQIDSVAMIGNTICAYSTDKKLEKEKAEKYITNILEDNGFNCSIKIYRDINIYLTCIDEMKNKSYTFVNKTGKENKNEIKAVETLLAISI